MQGLISEHSAARFLDISVQRLRALVREHSVPHVELPDGEIRFRMDDLVLWIEARRFFPGGYPVGDPPMIL